MERDFELCLKAKVTGKVKIKIRLTLFSNNTKRLSLYQSSMSGIILDEAYSDLISIKDDLNYSINNNIGLYLPSEANDKYKVDYESEISKYNSDYEMGYYMFKEHTAENVIRSNWFKTLTYPKNALFFKNHSFDIFYFNFQAKVWEKVETHNHNFYFGSGVRAIELPDLSYFITGGSDENGTPVNTVGHFQNSSIINKPNMKRSRKCHLSVYLTGYVYVFGGISEYDTPTDDCERFSLIQNNKKWQKIARMNYPRAYATPLVYGANFIFIIGGYCNSMMDSRSKEYDTIERYDVKRNIFELMNLRLKKPCYGVGATLVQEYKILILGGNSEYKGMKNDSLMYTINLLTGAIEIISSIDGCNWTTMPIYYCDGELNMFLTGEEKDGCPAKISHKPF
jgi:hypothetical protein